MRLDPQCRQPKHTYTLHIPLNLKMNEGDVGGYGGKKVKGKCNCPLI